MKKVAQCHNSSKAVWLESCRSSSFCSFHNATYFTLAVSWLMAQIHSLWCLWIPAPVTLSKVTLLLCCVDNDQKCRQSLTQCSLYCYDKIPQTGYLMNDRNLLLTVLEGGSPRSGCQHGQSRSGKGARGDLFCRNINLIYKAPSPNSLPKVPPAHTITWGIRIPTCDSGGDTYSGHSTKRRQENENKLLAMWNLPSGVL